MLDAVGGQLPDLRAERQVDGLGPVLAHEHPGSGQVAHAGERRLLHHPAPHLGHRGLVLPAERHRVQLGADDGPAQQVQRTVGGQGVGTAQRLGEHGRGGDVGQVVGARAVAGHAAVAGQEVGDLVGGQHLLQDADPGLVRHLLLERRGDEPGHQGGLQQEVAGQAGVYGQAPAGVRPAGGQFGHGGDAVGEALAERGLQSLGRGVGGDPRTALGLDRPPRQRLVPGGGGQRDGQREIGQAQQAQAGGHVLGLEGGPQVVLEGAGGFHDDHIKARPDTPDTNPFEVLQGQRERGGGLMPQHQDQQGGHQGGDQQPA